MKELETYLLTAKENLKAPGTDEVTIEMIKIFRSGKPGLGTNNNPTMVGKKRRNPTNTSGRRSGNDL